MSVTTRKKNRQRMSKLHMEALIAKKEEPKLEEPELRLEIPADPVDVDLPIDIPEDLEVLAMPKPKPIFVSKEDYDTLDPEGTIKKFCSDIRKMIDRYEENEKTIYNSEDETQDILHSLEMSSDKNCPGGYAFYRKLTDVRRKRRRAKNENDLLQPIYDIFHGTNMLDRLSAVQGECGRIKKSISAKGYSLRTDVVDDLF